jgi:hypothetical protein
MVRLNPKKIRKKMSSKRRTRLRMELLKDSHNRQENGRETMIS